MFLVQNIKLEDKDTEKSQQKMYISTPPQKKPQPFSVTHLSFSNPLPWVALDTGMGWTCINKEKETGVLGTI